MKVDLGGIYLLSTSVAIEMVSVGSGIAGSFVY